MSEQPVVNQQQIAAWMRHFVQPGDVVEIRMLEVSRPGYSKPHTESGFFDADHIDDLVALALHRAQHAVGTYFTFNPLRGSILARRANRIDAAATTQLAADTDVTARRWIVIDCDVKKDPHISASAEEKALARQTAETVREHLRGCGWPEPILADSGNGYHLFYRVELPVNDSGKVRAVLNALGDQFDNDRVRIDRKLYNPSRIIKLPGSWARKGDDVPDRPHRVATFIDVPALVQVVPAALLDTLASCWSEEDVQLERAAGGPVQWTALPAGVDQRRVLDRARAYLAKVDGAVSGQDGHDNTYRAAAILIVRFGLSVADALPLMEEWNLKCKPEWSHKDLLRKLEQVDAKETGARGGYLREFVREHLRTQYAPRGSGGGGGTSGGATSSGDTGGAGQSGGSGGGDDTPATGMPAPTLPPLASFTNYYEETVNEGTEQAPRNRIQRIGLPLDNIRQQLLAIAPGWPRRIGDLLFARNSNHRPQWLRTPEALFAWLARQLPQAAQRNAVMWAQGHDKISQRQLFEYLQQTAQEYEALEMYPHEPQLPSHYYMHRELPAVAPDTNYLDRLLKQFRPLTNVDAALVRAFFVTLVWGGPPGRRPAFLFTAPEDDSGAGRGTGKSTIAQLGSLLVGGYIGLSPNEPIGDIQRRLLSPKALEKRVSLLDNIKSLRFSWGELESVITDSMISGRQMYTGEGQRANSFTWVMTFNGASLSRDLAQRCLVVKLDRPVYSATWEDETKGLIESHRWEILAELVAVLRREPLADVPVGSRWGSWERNVLARVTTTPEEYRECQAELKRRQSETDADSEAMEELRHGLRAWLASIKRVGDPQPDEDFVFIPSDLVHPVVVDVTGDRKPKAWTMRYLLSLGIPEVKQHRTKHERGILWKGGRCKLSSYRLLGDAVVGANGDAEKPKKARFGFLD